MSVNKNTPGVAGPAAVEPACAPGRLRPPAGSRDDAAEQQVVLDDLAPARAPSRSLGSRDLNLLRALQSILEKRQADAWIDEMKREISAELEWRET